MRPMNAIVAGLAAVIGYFIATSAIIPAIVLLVVIVFLVTAGGNVINDYYDSEIDAINRPGRPIPSGEVKKRRRFIWPPLCLSRAFSYRFYQPALRRYCNF